MLILSRHPGETIRIGDDISVTVVAVSADGVQVRFGITAPREVPVHRSEIHERIQREKRPKK